MRLSLIGALLGALSLGTWQLGVAASTDAPNSREPTAEMERDFRDGLADPDTARLVVGFAQVVLGRLGYLEGPFEGTFSVRTRESCARVSKRPSVARNWRTQCSDLRSA